MTYLRSISVSISFFVGLAGLGGLAHAEAAHSLDAEDVRAVTEACERDQPFLPIVGDRGRHTGEYALPVRDQSGQVIAAIVLTDAALRSIPGCKKSPPKIMAGEPDREIQMAALTS
jgi:hypothetical protein